MITWDGTGAKKYETGVDRGVLYPMDSSGAYQKGVAWNGLTSVSESPEGAELTDLYADNIKYASLRSAEKFGGTIEAYTYPDEFGPCDGSAEVKDGVFISQQGRNGFGFCYRTGVGSDASGDIEKHYKIHIVYGCTCSPSEKSYQTVNDSPEAITFSWEFDSTPATVTGHKPTSEIIIDSTKCDEDCLAALEEALYGGDDTDGELPTPDEVIALMTPATNPGGSGGSQDPEGT